MDLLRVADPKVPFGRMPFSAAATVVYVDLWL
jgi:hypothetical protein